MYDVRVTNATYFIVCFQISNGSSDMDQKSNISGIKIQHLTSSAGLGHSRFPKLEECAHFHYEHVELNSLQVSAQLFEMYSFVR